MRSKGSVFGCNVSFAELENRSLQDYEYEATAMTV
jgi:hypothetical protein